MNKDKKVMMFFAALLHDVGKPAVTAFSEKKQDIVSPAHDKAGAEIAQTIVESFLPKKFHKPVVALVKNHMIDVKISDKALLKKADDLEKNQTSLNDLIDLRTADGLGRICVGKPDSETLKENNEFRQRIDDLGVLNSSLPHLIQGKDLISLGFVPGKSIGMIIDEVRQLQFAQRIKTKEEALAYAATRLKNIHAEKTTNSKLYKIIQDVVRTSFRISLDATKGIIRKVKESDITDIDEAKKLACHLALEVILKRKGLK